MTDTRYAAQAVTVDGYGDPEIVVQPIDGDPDNDWPTGDPIATVIIDGDFTDSADLDHALTASGSRGLPSGSPATSAPSRPSPAGRTQS